MPGLRLELVTELIRSLPKQLRTRVRARAGHRPRGAAPAGHRRTAACWTPWATSWAAGPALVIPRDAFDLSRLPAHLRMTYRVLDGDRVLASGKDLDALRQQLAPRLRATLSQAARGLTRTGLRRWDIGTLPQVFESGQVRAYPALADAGDSVNVAAVRDPGPGPGGDAAGHPAADPAPGRLRGARGRGRPAGGDQAGAEPAPVRQRRRAAGRLRGLRGRRGHRPGGRAGLGRGGLRPAAGGGPRVAGPGRGRAWSAVVARVLAEAHEVEVALDRRDQRGAGPGGGRPAGPARRADLPRVRGRHRRRPADRPGPLPAGHVPAAGQGARRAGPGRRADGDRARGSARTTGPRWPGCRRPSGTARRPARCAG